MTDRLQERETDLKQYTRQREDLGKQLEQPFEHGEKLATAIVRQQEIIQALDITRNQASSTVADSPEENQETQKIGENIRSTPARSARCVTV